MTRNHNEKARKEIEKAVELRKGRRRLWAEEGERSLWQNLSMFGALGWLIVVPTLVGVLLGRWLDGRYGTGITFTGALIVVGVCFGFWMAWRRMNEK